MDMDPGLELSDLPSDNTQPLVTINLFHPFETADPALTINISYSYSSDQGTLMQGIHPT